MWGLVHRYKSDAVSAREWGGVLPPGGIDMRGTIGTTRPVLVSQRSQSRGRAAINDIPHVNTFLISPVRATRQKGIVAHEISNRTFYTSL